MADRRKWLLVSAVLVVVAALIWSDRTSQVRRCMVLRDVDKYRMHELWCALERYAGASGTGEYPDQLHKLVDAGYVPADWLKCPSLVQLHAPGPHEFRYVRPGTGKHDPGTPLIYPPPEHYCTKIIPLLSADGRIRLVAAEDIPR